jgi:hypothetical protein
LAGDRDFVDGGPPLATLSFIERRNEMRHLQALVTALALTACGEGMLADGEDLAEGEESRRELATTKTCTVAAESVGVRTCWASSGETNGVKKIACGLLGPVFATQSVRSVLPLTSITSPVDSDEKLLGSRLESLGLIDVAKDLPKDLAAFNGTILAVREKLAAAAGNQCESNAWRIGAVDQLLDAPRGLGFICAEMTNGTTLLDCSGSAVQGSDSATSSPGSITINGVSISFAKTGCGSFRYGLKNTSSSTNASYSSSVSGIALAPACQGTLQPGSTQTCSVSGIKGGGTRWLSYKGTVTRGGSTVPFSFNISVRCD